MQQKDPYINRNFTTIAPVSGKIRFQHVSTVCNSRFSKPSVVLWWDGFGRFGIKTATICTIPRAARSEDWVKVVSGGRWNIMKRGNHLNIYIFPKVMSMKEFFLQYLQRFKIHRLRHRKLHCTFTSSYSLCHCRSGHHWQWHCASPWTICSDSIVQKSKSSCHHFGDRSIAIQFIVSRGPFFWQHPMRSMPKCKVWFP